jgi:hypothetical protein
VRFQPTLLRSSEFLGRPEAFRYFDVEGEARSIALSSGTLAFTFCQVPVVYERVSTEPSIEVVFTDGSSAKHPGNTLDHDSSAELFSRGGRMDRILVGVPERVLL